MAKFDYEFDYEGDDFNYLIQYNECNGEAEDVTISIDWGNGKYQVLDATPDWAIERADEQLADERAYSYDDQDR